MTLSEHPPSWYAASLPPAPPRTTLQGAGRADVAVLGGGYTGLTAALALAERGFKVTLLEAARIGWGASGRNGGQALAGYGCDLHTLEALVGRDDARLLFDFSRDGLHQLKQRIARHRIDCDWRDGHANVAITPRQQRALAHRYRAHGTALGLPTAMVGPRATAPATGQRTLHRRAIRPGQRPPASIGLCAGAGARGRGGRRHRARTFSGAAPGARHAPRAARRARPARSRLRGAGRQCLAAGHRAGAGDADDAGRHLDRRDRTTGCRARTGADPQRHGRGRRELGAWTTSASAATTAYCSAAKPVIRRCRRPACAG